VGIAFNVPEPAGYSEAQRNGRCLSPLEELVVFFLFPVVFLLDFPDVDLFWWVVFFCGLFRGAGRARGVGGCFCLGVFFGHHFFVPLVLVCFFFFFVFFVVFFLFFFFFSFCFFFFYRQTAGSRRPVFQRLRTESKLRE